MAPARTDTPLLNPAGRWLLPGVLGALAVAAGMTLPALLAGSGAATLPPGSPSDPVEVAVLPDLGSLVLRLGLGTVAVLGLCAMILWAGKHRQRAAAGAAPGAGMKVLETLSLGNGCFVHLVRAGTSHTLVGMDRAGCKRLLVLPEPLEADAEELLV